MPTAGNNHVSVVVLVHGEGGVHGGVNGGRYLSPPLESVSPDFYCRETPRFFL